jgi:hypothetical protein
VLAVRADEKERVLDGRAGPKLDAAEVVVRLELCSRDGGLLRSRRSRKGDELRRSAPIRSPEEEQPAVWNRAHLIA